MDLTTHNFSHLPGGFLTLPSELSHHCVVLGALSAGDVINMSMVRVLPFATFSITVLHLLEPAN